MRFSLRLNNDLPLADYIALAQAAEEVGFDQFWVSNDLFLRSAAGDSAGVALATARIEVGTGHPQPVHDPSGRDRHACRHDGRTERQSLQPGAGGGSGRVPQVGGHRARGDPGDAARDDRGRARGCSVGERVAIDGQFLHWSNEAYLRFAAPRVTPIYIGAMGPKMLALSGELADGALPLLFPPEHYFGVLPYLQEGMARRDPALGRTGPGRLHLGFAGRGPGRCAAACWRRRSPTTATRWGR